jgi:chromosome segregation ATPase
MKLASIFVLTACVAFGASACKTAPTAVAGVKIPKLVPFQADAEETGPKLYGRDGGVVSAAQPGSVGKADASAAGLASDAGTRTRVIELYQQAVEERDRLRSELTDFATALQQSQQRVEQLELELRSQSGAAGLSSQEHDRLLQENMDLAGRLATAQIRRLEAEKALLELMVAQAETASTAVQPKSPDVHSGLTAPAAELAHAGQQH